VGVIKLNNMETTINELLEIAEDIIEKSKKKFKTGIPLSDAISIAVKMQQNWILEEAFMTGKPTAGALEAIAISLGYR